MPKDIQKAKNVQQDFNQFDNMSLDGKPIRKENGLSSVDIFRPTDKKVEKQRFHAEEKPTVEFGKTIEKKKINLKPIIIGVASVAVIAGIVMLVPALKTGITTLIKGADKEYLRIEQQNFESSVTDVSSFMSTFSKWRTDNALKGNYTLVLNENNSLVREDLTGKYTGTYKLENSMPLLSLSSTNNKEGITLGDTIVCYNFKDMMLTIDPSWSSMFVEADLPTLAPELDDIGINIDSEELLETLNQNNGYSTTDIIASLQDSEYLTKMLVGYVQMYTELNATYDISTNIVASGLPENPELAKVVSVEATWKDVKSMLDSIVQSAKEDKTLMKFFSAYGYSEQKYLDMVNGFSTDITGYYNSVTPDTTVKMLLGVNGEDKILYRQIMMPISATNNLIVSITNIDGEKSIKVSGADNDFELSVIYTQDENARYTGTFLISTEDKYITCELSNVVLENTISGEFTITSGEKQFEVSLLNTSTPSIVLNYKSNNVEVLSLNADYSTYVVADITRPSGSNKLSLYSLNEASLKKWLETGYSVDNLITYIEKTENVIVDKDSLLKNIITILIKWGSFEYDFELLDIASEYVDPEVVLNNAIVKANKNAKTLHNGCQNFLKEIEKAGSGIPDAIYCGTLTEDKADFNYKPKLSIDNLEKCLSLSVSKGYYCVVIRKGKVAYTFWSDTVDLQPYVDTKTLPTSFTSFNSVDEVVGSYPEESGRGE